MAVNAIGRNNALHNNIDIKIHRLDYRLQKS